MCWLAGQLTTKIAPNICWVVRWERVNWIEHELMGNYRRKIVYDSLGRSLVFDSTGTSVLRASYCAIWLCLSEVPNNKSYSLYFRNFPAWLSEYSLNGQHPFFQSFWKDYLASIIPQRSLLSLSTIKWVFRQCMSLLHLHPNYINLKALYNSVLNKSFIFVEGNKVET